MCGPPIPYPACPQLWEISSGELLLSVLFDVGIMAVTMDLAEHHMFCGGSEGSIFQVDLCTWVSGGWLEAQGTVGCGGFILQRPWNHPSPLIQVLEPSWLCPCPSPQFPGAPVAEA